MPTSSRQKFNRKQRQQELSVLPTFTSANDYEVFLVNHSTDFNILHDLIQLAQNTKYFAVDTEGDFVSNTPSLIQVEFIHNQRSTVVLVEVCHLPAYQEPSSLAFWLIRSLFKFIFQANNVILSWGSHIAEFVKFLDHNLFTVEMLYEPKPIDLQDQFRDWHYSKYGFYATGGNQWGLQAAVADQFDEYLDKTQRLNRWSRGLDCEAHGRHNPKVRAMINYAVNDCLAVTKLARRMHMIKVIS